MTDTLTGIELRNVATLGAYALLGFVVSYAIAADTVRVPVVGDVSGLLLGGLALVVGVALYATQRGGDDCGCC